MKQGDRCNNSSNPDYKYYGRVGVKREWSSRECISWYLDEYQKKDSWIDPVVSRKKDKGNYTLKNCKLLERKENSRQVKRDKESTYNKAIDDVLGLMVKNYQKHELYESIQALRR